MKGSNNRAVAIVAVILAIFVGDTGLLMAADPEIPRDFSFGLPLFAGPWLENASGAEVSPDSDAQILRTFKVLCGDDTGLAGTTAIDFPYPDVSYDEFTMPIFGAGAGQQSVVICDYEGTQWYANSKWGVPTLGGPVSVPSCSGQVRPSDPTDLDSDGHLILYDPATFTEYDFWQATTVRSGPCQSAGGGQVGSSILEAGSPDFFDVRGDGSNPRGEYSARAMGTALLAGLILPEDVESGSIDHALALAILGPRNLSPDPSEPLDSDIIYPAATTETDMYSTAPFALAAGQRIRARPTLVDDSGTVIDEVADLAPITRMLFAALRTYGAYVVDNAGGFTFYAEDIHSADLNLSNDQVNVLIGEPVGTPLPAEKTKWQLVIEAVNDDLWNHPIPIAYGSCAGASSSIITMNFEVVANASADLLFADGFEDGSTSRWSLAVP
jgi:hypothetical protein